MEFNKFLLTVVIILIVTVCALSANAAVPSAPTNLKCEYITNPLGIDTATPRFSWIVNDTDKGEKQNAYQIIVASSQALIDVNNGDKWNTGMVSSSNQNGIKYNGGALTILTPYWWKVKTWDKDNYESPWSSAATFETAMFSLSSWPTESKWFSAVTVGDVVILRKQFVTDTSKTISSARLYIAAHMPPCEPFKGGWYIYMNENPVGANEIQQPGQSYPYAVYSVYDVKNQLLSGNNIFAILTRQKVRVYLKVKYTDATSMTMVSDRTWKTKIVNNWISVSGNTHEYTDARNEPIGWKTYGFDHSRWGSPGTEGDLWATLRGQGCPWVIQETFNPISVSQPSTGVYLVDFGQNMTGFPQITVNNIPSGTVITYHPNEILNADGTVMSRLKWNEICTYTTRGDATEVIKPLFAFQGFRYVQISGCPQAITSGMVKAYATCSDILNGNNFTSSSTLINRIQKNALWGFRNCLISIPVDCPHRERLGWCGDAWAASKGELREFNLYKFYELYMDEHVICQPSDGQIQYALPTGSNPADTDLCPVWAATAVLIPWHHYQEYGDKEFLNRYYAMGKKWINFLDTIDVNYRLINSATWGDWVAVGGGCTDSFCKDATFYRVVKVFSLIANELGNTTDYNTYNTLATNIKNAINTTYLHQDGGGYYYYDNGSQGSQGMALAYGIPANDTVKNSVKTYFINKIISDGYNVKTGMVSTEALLQALSETGNNDTAYMMITNLNSGWARWVRWGATTSWEYWTDVGGNMSLCHAFLAGSVNVWLHEELAGLKPSKPGFKEIIIKPYIPSDMTNAKSEINTVRGYAKSEWSKSGSTITLNAVIPVNSTATIYCQAASRSSVTEPSGVTYIETVGGYVVYSAGSGSYSFSFTQSQSSTPTPTPTGRPAGYT